MSEESLHFASDTDSDDKFGADWRESTKARLREYEEKSLGLKEAIRKCNLTLPSLESMVKELQRRLSSSLAISRLPPEMLYRIFIMAASDEVAAPRWFAFSQVCQRWRAVALGCPMLWTTIDFSWGTSQVEEFLVRSKQLLLSVTIHRGWNDDYRTSYPECNLFKHSMFRVRDLYMNTPKFYHVGSAKQLKRLTLISLSLQSPDWNRFSKYLDGSKAPVLEFLKISGSGLNPKYRICAPNLREFHLSRYSIRSMDSILSILGTMPLLEIAIRLVIVGSSR